MCWVDVMIKYIQHIALFINIEMDEVMEQNET